MPALPIAKGSRRSPLLSTPLTPLPTPSRRTKQAVDFQLFLLTPLVAAVAAWNHVVAMALVGLGTLVTIGYAWVQSYRRVVSWCCSGVVVCIMVYV